MTDTEFTNHIVIVVAFFKCSPRLYKRKLQVCGHKTPTIIINSCSHINVLIQLQTMVQFYLCLTVSITKPGITSFCPKVLHYESEKHEFCFICLIRYCLMMITKLRLAYVCSEVCYML